MGTVSIASGGRASDFENTALPHLRDLFRVSVRVMADATVAEDIVQETFLEAWKSFDRFEPGTNCRAWLFKILFRRVYRHRNRKTPLELIDAGSEVEEVAGSAAPISDRVTDKDILAALDQIPPQFRETVLLADVEEFSYKEIASILAVPVGTVMSRLNRGRRMLRTCLAEIAEEYGFGGTGVVNPS